jgi:signal recognition particle subunit SEC65
MLVEIDKKVTRRGRPTRLSGAIHEEKERVVHEAGNKLEYVPVNDLVPYKGNPRTHSRQQIRKVAESIKHFGFCAPVLVDDDRQIIAGHGPASKQQSFSGWRRYQPCGCLIYRRPKNAPIRSPTTGSPNRQAGIVRCSQSSCRPWLISTLRLS